LPAPLQRDGSVADQRRREGHDTPHPQSSARRYKCVAASGPTDLTWDSSLANGAQGWANIIGPSKHSECHSGAQGSGQGENIADFGTVEAGVQFWYNEKAQYKYPTPVAAGAPYLHYTQMVWRGTQRIGCGKAPSAKYWPTNIVLVCRYSPAGNFFGRAPY
jgi:pathogenesis-related protein 1